MCPLRRDFCRTFCLSLLAFFFAALSGVAHAAAWTEESPMAAAAGQQTTLQGDVPWRIRFFEAATVEGTNVLLGEVAEPVGGMPTELWQQYKMRQLWPSPPENKGAVNMTRPKLQEAVVSTMRDLAPYCLFPGSMALQRGGAVYNREAVHQLVVKELTPYLHALPGESSFSDFRLPPYIFLQHSGQTVGLEEPKKIAPGRLNIRLVVKDLDGRTVQKASGSIFIDCWTEAPSAAVPLNRDDILEPDKITFVRANLAHLKDNVWDGKGGPWRVLRPIGVQQVIYQRDLGYIPTIRKGAIVHLTYEGKSVSLTTQVEAMADGTIGESIPVRNLQSKKEIHAVVRDAGNVVIQPAQSFARP